MKNFIIILFSTLSICCNNINKVENENKILEFQKTLIEDEVTGSNIAMVFKDGHMVYKEIINFYDEIKDRLQSVEQYKADEIPEDVEYYDDVPPCR